MFTFDIEAKALEAVCSSFVPSFVLFRMFCNDKQRLSILALSKQHRLETFSIQIVKNKVMRSNQVCQPVFTLWSRSSGEYEGKD